LTTHFHRTLNEREGATKKENTRRAGASRDSHIVGQERKFPPSNFTKRDLPGINSRFVTQNSSPGHLSWISQLSRQNNIHGTFNDFETFLYDDRSLQSVNPPVAVYVIDTGFLNTHNVSRPKFY
jgi:hypothetical protein